MSKHVREESEFRWNEWLVLEIGRRTENEEETNKKDERNQKVKMCLCGTSSGYYLLTLPLEVYEGYQPINKRRKWMKEVCAKPLVNRSPSWFLMSIFTRVILWEGSDTLSRNQWYLMA